MFNLNQVTATNHLSHKKTGSISDNADGYWDNSEYDFYRFKVKDGETFEAELILNHDAEIYLMYFEGDDPQDIENVLSDIVYYGYSDRVYELEIAINRIASFSFYSANEIDAKIAIFSYTEYSVSTVDYTLYTSIPEGSRSEFSDFYILIFLVIVVVIIIIIVRKRRKKNQIRPMGQSYRNQPPIYTQPQYNAPYQQYNQPALDNIFCSECGIKNLNTAKFCVSCGTKFMSKDNF